MDIEPKYTFIYLQERSNSLLQNGKIQEFFNKWGINFISQSFLFNEPYQQYHKFILAEAFFKDQIVAQNLKIWDSIFYKELKLTASEVEVQQIPCTITSMSLFDKLKDPKNAIVYESGHIRQTYSNYIDGILIADNLRAMILDEANDKYNLYTKHERNEFIFRIFQMLVLGGEYCQYEDNLDTYLDMTKVLYKHIIRIQKAQSDDNLTITTVVLEVIAKNDNAYFPKNPHNIQNIGFLLVDPVNREITTFLHQY